MTNYEKIKDMSIDDMALMLNELIKETENRIIDSLANEGISLETIRLLDEIQIEIYKCVLESEVEKNE